MVFTYETVNYFSKKINSIYIEELSDFETEKNTSEADETDNENEKKDKIEDFYINSNYFTTALLKRHSLHTSDFIIFATDYSTIVYSPPEALTA
jgi:hypothetical protein